MADTPQDSPLDRQVDGEHYKLFPIQPIEFCMKNNLNPIQTFIIKHASRYTHKGEAITDLEKIIHYAELGIAFEKEALAEIRGEASK